MSVGQSVLISSFTSHAPIWTFFTYKSNLLSDKFILYVSDIIIYIIIIIIYIDIIIYLWSWRYLQSVQHSLPDQFLSVITADQASSMGWQHLLWK